MRTGLAALSGLKALGALALLLAAVASRAQSVMPTLVNFEGRLTDAGGNPLNGTQNLTVRIYGAATGGTPLWSETQNNVVLSSGVFSVQLGALTPLTASVFSGSSAYLEFQVGSETLAPRKQLVATPYSVNAGTFRGLDYSSFILHDMSTFNVGIGAASQAGTRLYVHGGATTPTLLLQNSGTGDDILRLVTDGNGAALSLQSAQVYSSLPLHIGNGQNTYFRTDLGGSVGVGQTSPSQALDVNGNLKASQLCVPGTLSPQGDCASSFRSCQFVSYGTPQKAAWIPVDDMETSCPTGFYVMNMQYFVANGLPGGGTMLCCQ